MIAEIAAAGALACRPERGLGSVTFTRRGVEHVVDLGTCRERIVRSRMRHGITSPDRRWTAEVRSSGIGRSAKQTIWITNRRTERSHAVFSETQWYTTTGPGETPGPIVLLKWSGDDRWIFFTIDPGASASIMADGLTLRVVSAAGGPAHRLAGMLIYPDYLAWCSGRLVFTAGVDRIAADRKRLLVARPPAWRARPLVTASNRSWGSLACAPGGRWLVGQLQRQNANGNFFATHWALWRIGFDGSTRRLTSPPRRYADESPRFARDRSLLFVRSRNGFGKLYALRRGRVLGPLLSLGVNTGYYGHHDWWSDF